MQVRRQYFSVNNFQKSKPKNDKHFNGLPTKTWEPAHRWNKKYQIHSCNKPNKIWVKENWGKNDFCDSYLNNKNYSNCPNSQIRLRSYSIMIITECSTASWNVREKACESSKQTLIYKSRQELVALEIEYKAFMYK